MINNDKNIHLIIAKLQKNWLILSVFALILGILSVVLSHFILPEKLPFSSEIPDFWGFISALIFPIGILLDNKKGTGKAIKTNDKAKKLELYAKGTNYKLLFLGISLFFIALAILVATHPSVLYVFGGILILHFINRPSVSKFRAACKYDEPFTDSTNHKETTKTQA